MSSNPFAEDSFLQGEKNHIREPQANELKFLNNLKPNEREDISSGQGEAQTESSSAAIKRNKKQEQDFILEGETQSESDFDSQRVFKFEYILRFKMIFFK